MLYSGLSEAPLSERVFDVCIAGGGPAGITLARRLASQGMDVLLMEGGGLELTVESQDLYDGKNIGLDYYEPYTARLRYLGGSSNHWGGRCRELDAMDFHSRPYHPLSGWPLEKAELDAYAEEADAILEIGPRSAVPDTTVKLGGETVERLTYRHSPVKFLEKYLDELKAAPNIHVVINANLVDLELNEGLKSVRHAVFRSHDPGEREYRISAQAFCLCMGGLENPRFMLNVNRQVPAGIGNENDLVGRYFMEHPHFVIGDILFEDTVPETENYSMPMDFQDDREMLNFSVRVVTEKLHLLREVSRTALCATSFGERLARAVLGRNIDCDVGGADEYFDARAFLADNPVGHVQVNTEQFLNPDSRVTLLDETDALGMRRIAVDWQLADEDFHTMRVAGEWIGQRVAAEGLGRVRLRDWLLNRDIAPPGADEEMPGGHHHMCTTRMSDDPKQGVVDRNCQVHGVENLFIGGSSVFATAGHANPTYSIVQLALRLGDHLGEALQQQSMNVGRGLSPAGRT
ncbi:GMC oxidoreductase [Amaricoccus tamworthensis]|uniref:GMC oxidoreductase n=1 Tax=Amaricoccus tamworthensis TaxID=57002 RepID=UPI003C7A9521